MSTAILEAPAEAPPTDIEFTVKKSAFHAALERVAPALPGNDVIPVLRNFHLDTRAPVGLKVMATRVELTLQTSVEEVTVKGQGVALLPAQKLLSICKEASDGDLTISVRENTAKITVGRATWSLSLKDATQFPDSPSFLGLDWRQIARDEFLKAVRSVAKAASREVSRSNLMMLDIDQGRMRASDGVRFQQVTLPTWPKDFDTQIPTSILPELTKLLRSSEATEFNIAETDSHLIFQVGNNVLLSTKLLVKFPPIDKQLLAPVVNNTELLQVDREALSSAIKRVRIAADPESPAVVLKLSEDALVVAAQDKRLGAVATEALDVSWKSGKRQLSFNAQPLLDLLAMTDAQSCDFWLGKDAKSRSSSLYLKDEDGLVGVLNQMRIDWSA